MQKAGFISVIGRTNAGKSSMINSLLGENLAIISHKRNATRRKINAIVMHENNQLIFIDTPGLHKSQKVFNQKLVEIALKSIEGVDLVLFVASIKDDLSEYKDFLSLACKIPHIVILNKIDLVDNAYLLAKMNEYSSLSEHFKALLPYSSKQKSAKKALLDAVVKLLPEHPHYYDSELLSSAKEKDIYKDFILEAIFESFSDELPYQCELEISRFEAKEHILFIDANIITSSHSHKAMIIGKNAVALKRLGKNARIRIEKFAQKKVMLNLFVQVKKNWDKDEDFLKQILEL
ncbi:GTPase Era [Campylobacter sp. MIT 19-121]|uniref:GTPase Era n=1 Tax=Campylobacter sp. MIT 19-121 TaxID=2703906 RepID=UPI00138A128A|nr:GTPase Era [Campylobacter sp. MIT 19-121]NDJ26392.1 GTPase Era [Campylobacter sp. MIT 19-121]